ncbi:MAG: hypothetical protein SGI92_12800 [Bryobacteraceae bacterium]|nr:hypothetical protein [Bryobacteraceae bacterium]
MAALLSSLGLFGFALLLHLIWWRCRLPRNHTLALLVVFAVTPLIAILLWFAGGSPYLVGIRDIPGMALLYLGAVGCYLIAYTAIEETSPSLAIFSALQAAGSAGCSREELSAVITDSNFIKPRLDALRRDGILVAAGNGYILSPRGEKAARLAMLVSRLFNVEKNA